MGASGESKDCSKSVELVWSCLKHRVRLNSARATPQGRQPDHIYLAGPSFHVGTITGGATATSFTAIFPPTPDQGVYLIIVGFNDGSEASISFIIT